jgi:hypothetical protein
MMVDISHVADRTFYRTLVISRAPVIASHSAARALCDAPRNMTDDMLRAVAINGGVVQVNFYSGFISQAYRDASKAQKPEVDKAIQDLKDKYKAEGKEVTYSDIEKLQRSYADRARRSARGSTRSTTSPRSPASTTPVWAPTSTASPGNCRRASTRPPTCRRLPKRCWRAATPPPIATRSLAGTCCGSFAKWRR